MTTRMSVDDLAVRRTVMAADRTLLSWVRTSLSMIGFGFTVYKFVEYMGGGPAGAIEPLWKARNLGITFVGIGTVALCAAIIQYWHFVSRVRGADARPPLTLPVIVAAFLAVTGLLALANALYQVGPF